MATKVSVFEHHSNLHVWHILSKLHVELAWKIRKSAAKYRKSQTFPALLTCNATQRKRFERAAMRSSNSWTWTKKSAHAVKKDDRGWWQSGKEERERELCQLCHYEFRLTLSDLWVRLWDQIRRIYSFTPRLKRNTAMKPACMHPDDSEPQTPNWEWGISNQKIGAQASSCEQFWIPW